MLTQEKKNVWNKGWFFSFDIQANAILQFKQDFVPLLFLSCACFVHLMQLN